MSPETEDDGKGVAVTTDHRQPNQQLFVFCLCGFVVVYAAYGLYRFRLGVDFTYLAWPLRLLYGERPFSSELHTLLRPVEVFMTWPFRLYPELTTNFDCWAGRFISARLCRSRSSFFAGAAHRSSAR
jgi:hypothetical protein